jgi:hypothetical protein
VAGADEDVDLLPVLLARDGEERLPVVVHDPDQEAILEGQRRPT